MSEARIKQFEDAMREQGYTVFPPASESQPGDRTFYRCGAVKFPVGVTVGSGPAGGGWSPLEAMEYLAAQVLPELPADGPVDSGEAPARRRLIASGGAR